MSAPIQSVIAAALATVTVAASAETNLHFVTMRELYRNKVLKTPPTVQNFARDVLQTRWDVSSPKQANITEFSDGITNIEATEDGALRFHVGKEQVWLDWGNVDGKQPAAEQIHLWNSPFEVKLGASQANSTSSVWTLRVFIDSEVEVPRRRGKFSQATLRGPGPAELTLRRVTRQFDPRQSMLRPNGFRLDIDAEPGTVIEIKSLDVVRRVGECRYRKEIELPEGKVWRAVATVGNQGVLYVNGRRMDDPQVLMPRPFHRARLMYYTSSLDLTSAFQPGRNTIGLHAFRHRNGAYYSPYTYLQGQVVMESGEVIDFGSDGTWLWNKHPRVPSGWNRPGFTGSGWRKVAESKDEKTGAVAVPVQVYGFSYKKPWDRPVYGGRLVLKNPHESRLMYSAGQPVDVQVHVPAGFGTRDPKVTWTLNRVHNHEVSAVASGSEDTFTRQSMSLVFDVACARLPRGVYTLQVNLAAEGRIVEQRIPEPLLVAGPLPMKPTVGATYEDGMDLELETTIDFTDPDDPHPWVESDTLKEIKEPRIVERDGLRYRETRTGYRGVHCSPSPFFAYNMKFKHPGDFYLMVLEYPDDRERWMGVSLSSTLGFGSVAKTTPAVYTGGRYPVTHSMRKLKWIHLADAGWTAVNVKSLMKDVPAAASKLKIYRIKGRLPALTTRDNGSRRMGSVMESLSYRYAFAPRRPKSEIEEARNRGRAPRQPVMGTCRALEDFLATAERYAEYLRFCGQNVAVIGGYQYRDTHPNTLYSLQTCSYDGVGAARIPMEIRNIVVRVFRENDIAVLANIEFMNNSALENSPRAIETDARVRSGAPTIRMVTGEGRQAGPVNFLNPEVREIMFRVAEDVAGNFRDQPNFLGLHWMSYFGGQWLPSFRLGDYRPGRETPGPFHATYDDGTIARFVREAGIKVPGAKGDPQRFEKRQDFLTSDRVKARWSRWRSEKVVQFFESLSKRLRAIRPDMECVPALYVYPHHSREWLESGMPLREYMNNWGWDPVLFQEKDLWFTQMLHTQYVLPSLYSSFAWQGLEQNTGDAFYDLYRRDDRRAVMVHHGWLEIERSYAKLPKRDDWAQPFQSTMYTQVRDALAREPFTQALIGADPQLVMYGFMDCGFMLGNEQPLREFARVLRALPDERFRPVDGTGLTSNLALRQLRKDNTTYLVAANPGYWPVTGRVTLEHAGEVTALTEGKPVALGRDGVLRFSLAPYGVAAWRIEGDRADVSAWEIDPLAEADLAHMRGIVARARGYVENTNVKTVAAPDDLAFVRETADRIDSDIKAGCYARAWASATTWRLWALMEGDMKKAAGLSTNVKVVDAGKLPVIVVPHTDTAPELDGRLRDRVWRRARPSPNPFVTKDKWQATLSTTLRMAYDDTHLYVAVECEDPAPDAVQAQATGKDEKELWSSGDDIVGLFLQPDQSEARYYQMAFTAGGARFDQEVDSGIRNYEFAPPWQVATGRTANSWTAEAAIPLEALKAVAAPGRAWRGNAFRVFRANRAPTTYWSWVERTVHDTDRFGELRFVK